MKKILLVLLLLALLLPACAGRKEGLKDQIVGKWVDSSGYSIEFYDGGTGFIEGYGESIPDTTFAYKIINESTIQISFQGGTYDIGIEINGDKLIWKDSLGEVEYTRVN